VHSVEQRPNLRRLCEPLGETKGLIETVGFKNMTESMWWRTSANVSREWVPYWGDSNAETTGSKGYVDPRDRQQIGVAGARRTWTAGMCTDTV